MLFYFPEKYLNLTNELKKDSKILIKIKVIDKKKFNNKLFQIKALFNDQFVFINLFNIKLFNIYQINKIFFILCEIVEKNGVYIINSPQIINFKNETVPFYKAGVISSWMSKIINLALNDFPETEIFYKNYTIKQVFYNIHNGIDLKESLFCLKYLEANFFVYLFEQKKMNEIQLPIFPNLEEIIKKTEYVLSEVQMQLMKDIVLKLSQSTLKYFVYGEVGAGKTIIAILTILILVEAGFNVAFLVPTLALAYQHYEQISSILLKNNISCVLYVGSILKKKKIKQQISEGTFQVVIGTHALLYMDEFPNLGLSIIDEMHKFGVLQRAKLIKNAKLPNLLMLSATPIPRSLNMILNKIISYFCLPSYKSKKIITLWKKNKEIDEIIKSIQNRKVYWILPNIEENDINIGVLKRFEYLQKHFKNIELLHGQMKDLEKLEVINNFKKFEHGILVATTIVEIGINIPDADIIIIEAANQFGLSQLHQLRGRVGRNGQDAYCILISELQTKKIQYMKQFDNGFDISKKDLELRGAGKLMGIDQHGAHAFYFLNENDEHILEKAFIEKKIFNEFEIFDNDFDLEKNNINKYYV